MLSRLKKPIRDRVSRARSARSTHGPKGIRSGSVQLQESVREFESEIHKSLPVNNLQVLSLIKEILC